MNSRKRRSKLEIYLDILDAINTGESKSTRIMFQTNLSWNLVKKALKDLTQQGLLEKRTLSPEVWRTDSRTKVTYHITSRGLEVIKYFKRTEILLKLV